MSILGLVSLTFVSFLIFRILIKKNLESINVTLLILLGIQIGFLMGLRVMILANVLIFGLFFINKRRKRSLDKRISIFFILIFLIIIPLNEFFNGIHTFNEKGKFLEIHSALKKYYFWLPYKLYGEKYKPYNNWEYPEDYYATIFSLEAPGQVFYNYMMPIRIDQNGDYYYQMSYGRWGNVHQQWFKYGQKITVNDWL